MATHRMRISVREYGEGRKLWTKAGMVLPHCEGPGFNIELTAFQIDGKLVVLPPRDNDEAGSAAEAQGAGA